MNTFNCIYHPNELIHRVSLAINSDKVLYCLECLMDSKIKVRELFIPIKDFPKRIVQDIESNNPGKRLPRAPPSTWKALIDSHDKVYWKLNNHIEQQKVRVVKCFQKIEAEIFNTIQQTKQKLIDALDMQLHNLNSNFSEFKLAVDRHFEIDDVEYGNKKEVKEIEKLMFECKSYRELDSFIRELIEEREKQSIKIEFTEDETEFLQVLKVFKELVEDSFKKLPEIYIDWNIEETIPTNFNDQVSRLFDFVNSIPRLTLEDAYRNFPTGELEYIKESIGLDHMKVQVFKSFLTPETGIDLVRLKDELSKKDRVCLMICVDEGRLFYVKDGIKGYSINKFVNSKADMIIQPNDSPQKTLYKYMPSSIAIGNFVLHGYDNEVEYQNKCYRCKSLDMFTITEIKYYQESKKKLF